MIKNFLVSTRPAEKSKSVLERNGILIRNFPLTRIVSYGHDITLEKQITGFSPDSLVFTSEVGVRIFLAEYPHVIRDSSMKMFAIGEKTAMALERMGYTAIYPEKKDSAGLAEFILSFPGDIGKVALIRSKNADSLLLDVLNRAGVIAKDFHIYEVTRAENAGLIVKVIQKRGFMGIIVTSPMEAQTLFDLIKPYEMKTLPVYAIGGTTRIKLESLGIGVNPPFGESDFTKLVDKITENLRKK
ncbi:MAG: uroporphyrinogen-III synthase [Thermoplasmataceae archaeon]